MDIPSDRPRTLYIQVSSAYAPAWGFGGPIRLLHEYATLLCGLWETHVFAGDRDHLHRKTDKAFDARQLYTIHRRTSLSSWLSARNLHLLGPSVLWRMVRLLGQSKAPTIFHVAELRSVATLYAVFMRRLFSTQTILVHSAFGGLHHKRSRIRALYDKLFLPAFLRCLDVAAVQNTHEEREYATLLDAHPGCTALVAFVPLHVSTTELPDHWFADGKDIVAQMQVRRELGLQDASRVFCFLGRFHPEKGIVRALELFRRYLDVSGDDRARFLVIGRDEGEQERIVDAMANMRLEGNVDVITEVYEDRFRYYFAADVFIGLPTMYEETMLASIEALGCGTPVLLSREADAPYVQESGAGLIVDYDEQLALQALFALLDHPRSRQRAARAVANRFSAENAGRALVDAIEAAGRRRGVSIESCQVPLSCRVQSRP